MDGDYELLVDCLQRLEDRKNIIKPGCCTLATPVISDRYTKWTPYNHQQYSVTNKDLIMDYLQKNCEYCMGRPRSDFRM